jgi:hypothetical protein
LFAKPFGTILSGGHGWLPRKKIVSADYRKLPGVSIPNWNRRVAGFKHLLVRVANALRNHIFEAFGLVYIGSKVRILAV